MEVRTIFSLNFNYGRKREYKYEQNKRNNFEYNLVSWENMHNFWLQRLIDMCVSSIKWDGLDFIPKNRMEYFLCLEQGMVAYFEDEILGKMVLPCVGELSLNEYGLPSSYQVWGMNGYRRSGLIDGLNCVVFFNNQMANTDWTAINLYAARLTNSMLTGEINLNTQKTPFIIETDEDNKLTMKNVMAKLLSGAQQIFTTKNLINEENLRVHELKSPYIVDKITENTQIIWNEWLNYLGVPSQIVQKKERMLKDEVTQTMGGALASRTGRIGCREEGSKKVKEIFNDDIKPYYSVDRTPLPEYLSDTVQYFESVRGGLDG